MFYVIAEWIDPSVPQLVGLRTVAVSNVGELALQFNGSRAKSVAPARLRCAICIKPQFARSASDQSASLTTDTMAGRSKRSLST